MFRHLKYLCVFLMVVSCDGGLAPDNSTETGFEGKINFSGTWPVGITRTHLVLFKDPLLNSFDFNIVNLKYVSEEIPYGSFTYSYSTSLNSEIKNLEAGDHAYLAVAQSSTPVLSLDLVHWNIVGIYTGIDSTGRITLVEGEMLKNINILCDFSSLPPQPPGGLR